MMASQCWMPGRIEEAVGHSDADQMDLGSGGGELPFGVEGMLRVCTSPSVNLNGGSSGVAPARTRS